MLQGSQTKFKRTVTNCGSNSMLWKASCFVEQALLGLSVLNEGAS